jgi:ubiquinone biosynthesis accessory factor UbiK
MDRFGIDDIARRLLDSVPPAVRSMQQDLESNFRAVLRGTLSRLDLVARDEFDAQKKLLDRTFERVAALEARVAELERAGPKAGT